LPSVNRVKISDEPFKVVARTCQSQSDSRKLRVVCISDTHRRHRELKVPAGDVLIHCGDGASFTTALRDVIGLNEWFGTLPHRYKLVIAGNHEVCIDPEAPEATQKLYSNATYLQDSGIRLEGVHFWGAPWLPARGCCYHANAFSFPSSRMDEKWNKVPNSVDVLITHGPPHGVFDDETMGRIGDDVLLRCVTERVQPSVHVFGHTHYHRGACTIRVRSFEDAHIKSKLPDQPESSSASTTGDNKTADVQPTHAPADNTAAVSHRDVLFLNVASYTSTNMLEPIVFDICY